MAIINLNNKNHSIVVRKQPKSISVKKGSESNVSITHGGRRGQPGEKGDKGDQGNQGVEGKSAYQVAVENGFVGTEAQWLESLVALDKNYVQYFTALDTITINHNLAKYPAIQIFDSAGDEIEGSVYYVNTNQAIVSFTYPTSGTIICN